MEVISGLTTHSIVLCVEKRDRGLALEQVLKKKGFNVITVFSLYDGLKYVQQEMPHLVICDSILSDGTAGTLYDRLGQHTMLKSTPILVLVAKKTREQLTPLTGRKFSGFLLGQFDGATLLAKIAEVMNVTSDLSPFFLPLGNESPAADFTISVDAKVLGLAGEQVIYQSETEIDSGAALVCVPQDQQYSPVLLKMGTNVVRGQEVFNMFPLSRIRGKGRSWISQLPNVDINQTAQEDESKPPTKVLFFDPNTERFEQFKKVLSGYNMDLLHAANLQKATQIIQRDASLLGAAYFHELAGVAIATVKAVVDKLPAGERPPLIVGTTSQNIRSTADIRYIKRPFGLGVLVEMLEAAFKASTGALGDMSKAHQAANLGCNYQAPAKLLGLDETGGIIQLKFPVMKGNRLKLEHPFLSKIWHGDILAEITHTASIPDQPDVWQARFMAVSSKGNKAKYWEMVEKAFHEEYADQAQPAVSNVGSEDALAAPPPAAEEEKQSA